MICMKSDPHRARLNGPTKGSKPGNGHSGEGLASLRAGVERTNANSELRTAERKAEQSAEPVPGGASKEKSPAATQRG
jgi:hypothetical protein